MDPSSIECGQTVHFDLLCAEKRSATKRRLDISFHGPKNHPLCSASYVPRLHSEQTKLHVRDIGLRIPEHTQPRAGIMTDQAAASLINDLVQ